MKHYVSNKLLRQALDPLLMRPHHRTDHGLKPPRPPELNFSLERLRRIRKQPIKRCLILFRPPAETPSICAAPAQSPD